VEKGYVVTGFIDVNNAHIGERLDGVEIVGSLENVGKVIEEQQITDVIFSTDEIPYTAILSVIAHSKDRSVNFRLVPTSLESIIGKTRIDDLDALPLVEIDYNIHRLGNRVTKRLFDIVVSGGLLVSFYPVLRLLQGVGIAARDGRWGKNAGRLPAVLRGDLSFVGRPVDDPSANARVPGQANGTYLGPRGVFGLVQLHERRGLSNDERERYELYYAKNQSLLLDVDILVKSLLSGLRR